MGKSDVGAAAIVNDAGMMHLLPRPTGSHTGASSNLVLAKYLNTEGPQTFS